MFGTDIQEITPSGINFGLDSPATDNLVRQFRELAKSFPPIDGFRVDATPLSQDEIAQKRLDAEEVGYIEAAVSVENEIEEPGRQIGEYRYRVDRARRKLVRDRSVEVTARIDDVLRDVSASSGIGEWRHSDRWDELSDLVSQLDRLVGNMVPGAARWEDLHRHLRFAQPNDLSDIAAMDWPSVRTEVLANLYDDREPLPVDVDDLGELVRAQPKGPVTSQVDWSTMSSEDFERLVFDLVLESDGYENTNWPMKTSAPDRGRDVETYRVVGDVLADTRWHRVIIQCKHWTTKSVGRRDLIECVDSVTLWEPPLVDVLIVATTGRFSQDAVALAEKRNVERRRPTVELWPDNRIEMFLARRPGLAAKYGLR